MTIEKRKTRSSKTTSVSVRITEEGVRRLKVLSALYNQSQANVIEDLLDGTYEKELKSNAKDVRHIEVGEGLKPQEK
jgi:hypothetical protein